MKTINNELQYLELLQKILHEGEERGDRTNTGTLSLFGQRMEFNLQRGFPLLTTKKMFWRGILGEFIWMVVEGSIDVRWLQDRNINFWDEWVDENNTIGRGYGIQFRNRESFDQVQYVIDNIKNNPESRRHVISLWNQPDMQKTTLPCCHGNLIQFDVRSNEYLDCYMHARSQDCFLGMPFNIAFYSLFTHVIANITGYKAGKYIHSGGNCHIYKNHVDQVKEQLGRKALDPPEIIFTKQLKSIDDFDFDTVKIEGYESHSKIKAPVAV